MRAFYKMQKYTCRIQQIKMYTLTYCFTYVVLNNAVL